MAAILAWGAYVPRLRLSRRAVTTANAWVAPNLAGKGKGERSMAAWDEDALTMAVEAARDALGPEDGRSHVRRLVFASTTAPFADRLNAGIAAAALTLDGDIRSSDVGGSQRAALGALGDALEDKGPATLVVTGEMRRTRAASTQELDFGDAGAAFLVGDGPGCAELLGRGVVTADFVDHFRAADQEID